MRPPKGQVGPKRRVLPGLFNSLSRWPVRTGWIEDPSSISSSTGARPRSQPRLQTPRQSSHLVGRPQPREARAGRRSGRPTAETRRLLPRRHYASGDFSFPPVDFCFTACFRTDIVGCSSAFSSRELFSMKKAIMRGPAGQVGPVSRSAHARHRPWIRLPYYYLVAGEMRWMVSVSALTGLPGPRPVWDGVHDARHKNHVTSGYPTNRDIPSHCGPMQDPMERFRPSATEIQDNCTLSAETGHSVCGVKPPRDLHMTRCFLCSRFMPWIGLLADRTGRHMGLGCPTSQIPCSLR